MADGDPSEDRPAGSSPGPGVDRYGVPVIDPTKNVLDLVRAAIQRQDDLREMSAAHAREMQSAETRRMDEKAELRAEHGKELRQIETARLDAIRAVDVNAVQRAAEVQATQAGALAAQVATTADAFRASLAAALAPIQASIEDLRRAQYEAQGQKTQVVETSSADRDTLAMEAARIQAAAQRTQVYALIIAAIVLALGIYAAFHH